MYTERVLLADLQKVSGALERKAAAVGCVRLLADGQRMRTPPLLQYWPRLMQVHVLILTNRIFFLYPTLIPLSGVGTCF
jgi:hypothetical protein